MSHSYTTTAFVVTGPWSEETRKNPATKFLEIAAVEFFDTGDHSNAKDFGTEDFSITTPHATHHNSGIEDTFSNAIEPFYTGPLSKFSHEPYHSIAIETSTGWEIYHSAYLYANVMGDPHPSEQKIKDSKGQEWDVQIPVHYHFDILNDPGAKYGMKLDHCTMIKDTGLVNAKLDKRGHGHRMAYKQ